MRYRYLLGDSRREAARLKRQARLWDPVSFALFDRLRIRPGQRILEIGPGEGSLHRELQRRVRGPVDAVERSSVFGRRLRRRQARDGYGRGRIWESDLREVALPRGHYDLIFARWVFLFLPEPEAHLRRVVRALKPGGRLALQDYHRETWTLVPRPPEWEDFLAADRAFFATQGGDASIGGRLPELYLRAGLELLEVVPTVKTGRPGTAVWEWLTSYFLSVADRYAGCPPLTRKKMAGLRRRWRSAARRRTSLLIAPAVLDVVGRKPR
jgi:SAM-dependent methyltransferase